MIHGKEELIRLFRFFLVGGLNTLFGYLLFAFFVFVNFNYKVAVLFATVIGIFFNFFTTGRLVFKNNNNSLIFSFFIVYLITYIFNTLFIGLLSYAGVNIYLSGAITALPAAVISFLLMRFFVFDK